MFLHAPGHRHLFIERKRTRRTSTHLHIGICSRNAHAHPQRHMRTHLHIGMCSQTRPHIGICSRDAHAHPQRHMRTHAHIRRCWHLLIVCFHNILVSNLNMAPVESKFVNPLAPPPTCPRVRSRSRSPPAAASRSTDTAQQSESQQGGAPAVQAAVKTEPPSDDVDNRDPKRRKAEDSGAAPKAETTDAKSHIGSTQQTNRCSTLEW